MNAPSVAVYPGAFDPPTLGHLDVIRRGAALFGELVVAVGTHPGKDALWSPEQRVDLLRTVTADIPGVTIEAYDGLTVEYARRRGAATLLRGIRTMSDFDYESHLARTNRAMTGIETVFILAGERYGFINASLVKEIARLGGDVSTMVPPQVEQALRKTFA